MSIKVIERIEISAPQKIVAKYMFNPENDLSWIGGIKVVRDISKLPVQVGTRIHRIATFLSKEIDYILEVVDYEENHFLLMKSIKSPFPMEVEYQVDNYLEGSSMVQIRITGSSKGFFMFMDRLMNIMVSHNIKGDLRRLKNLAEELVTSEEQ